MLLNIFLFVGVIYLAIQCYRDLKIKFYVIKYIFICWCNLFNNSML